MMTLQEIEFACFSSQVGKVDAGNKCPVWRAQVQTASGKIVEAYIKHLPPRELFIECVAALIGRSLGLSIPRPILVQVFPTHLPELELERSQIIFGSQDVKYPSLQQFTSMAKAEEELRRWPDLLKAGCFDEWIANSDRHKGNILYNGQNFSLIDHSHAIPRGYPLNGCNTRNPFLELLAPTVVEASANRTAMKKVSNQLSNFLETAQNDWGTLTHAEDYLPIESAHEVLGFLNHRLPHLAELISVHLKNKQGDLYAASA